ncbi:hypothetical protein [Sandarakinorhabdus sp.]|uniref:hypothetical protein n=1 Tax=Sandarakinorhabdus sp. TaxID=1916663 RepID=UPI00286E8BD1|nr:hypothetical protein [Sandarakinorhabdus sp.]
MSEFVNQRFFDRPDALLAARGADSRQSISGPDGDVLVWITNGGIARPERIELASGTRLVRFAGTGHPASAMAGCWWLTFAEYARIEQLADSKGLPAGTAVRILCAVPPEWSSMDVIVQVRSKAPLLAYVGQGAPARQGTPLAGVSTVLSGWELGVSPARQLFIPGMGSGDVRQHSLSLEGTGFLPSDYSRRGFIHRVET